MAIYQFSALSDGQAIEFVPTADVLRFDQTIVAAADVRFTAVGGNTRMEVVSGPQAGRDVTLLNTVPAQLSQTNVTFADGSRLLVGNSLSSTTSDEQANSIAGGAGRDLIAGLGGNDTLVGGDGADVFFMSSGTSASYGADSINGGLGFDVLDFTGVAQSPVAVNLSARTVSGGGSAGAGSATLSGIDGAIGGEFNDTLLGSGAANRLEGGAGNDSISASSGNDTLRGGTGTDTLNGGSGADQIVFADAPGAANADLVTGFVSASDTLVLDRAAFGAVSAGNFVAGDGRFRAGAGLTSGQDGDDRIIYNTSTGQLFYDADGNGPGGSQLFATLSGAPALAATDIDVIGAPAAPPPSGNTIVGTDGDDSLTGTNGDDRIDGLRGTDTIDGADGDDTLIGGSDGDLFEFRAGTGNIGNDAVDGGSQEESVSDVLSFAGARSAVVVDMRTGTATGGGINGSGSVTFSNIEAVRGSEFDDHLIASDTVRDGFGDLRGAGLIGNSGNDTLVGGVNNDGLVGGDGNDVMHGGAGNDGIGLNSGPGAVYGNDTVDGGDGLDSIGLQNATSVLIDLSAGVVRGGDVNGGGSAILSSIEGVNLHGTADDLIIGDASANFVRSFGGFDTVRGGGGDDDIDLDISNETGSSGQPELYGEDGNDRLSSSSGNAAIGALLSGGAGNDRLGGDFFGSDRFLFDDAPGSANADVIFLFRSGSDTIELDAAAHPRLGAAGNFETGDARFRAGPQITSGQDADDRVIYDTATGRLFYDDDGSGPGGSQLIATLIDAPPLSAADIVVVGSEPPNSTVQGTAGNDSLTGTAGDDLLQGLAGNDTLTGLAGDDTLDAGTGADRLMGGTGDDTYIVDGAGDTVVEDAGEGIDTVQSSATRTLDANVENLTLTGSTAISGSGNALNNVINGNDANNLLRGGAGSDLLLGGGGNDRLEGGSGNDVLSGGDTGPDRFAFIDAPAQGGVDRITDFGGPDQLLFENAAFTALGAAGAWAAGDARFRSGAGVTSGQDSTDRLVYDTSTGSLYYDADGSGAGAAQLVATFDGNPTLTASHFTVI